jgi:hypothetical protein
MPSPLFLSSYVIRFGILASDYVLTLFSSRLGWFLERFHSNFFFSILVSVVFFFGGVLSCSFMGDGNEKGEYGYEYCHYFS